MLPGIYHFYQKEIFKAKKGGVVGQIRIHPITSKFYTVLLYIDSWNISHLHVPMSTLTTFRHPYCTVLALSVPRVVKMDKSVLDNPDKSMD